MSQTHSKIPWSFGTKESAQNCIEKNLFLFKCISLALDMNQVELTSIIFGFQLENKNYPNFDVDYWLPFDYLAKYWNSRQNLSDFGIEVPF